MNLEGPEVAYLDHAATTPLCPEARDAMAPFLGPSFGNPSGSHRMAREAKKALEEAREAVAEVLGAAPLEVVFTSGGTESDNLAVLGALAGWRSAEDGAGGPASIDPSGGASGRVVCSAVEHPAVLEACREAAGSGSAHGVLPVDERGNVQLAAISDVVTSDAAVVSVMAANNETGVVQPMAPLVRAIRAAAPEALVHSDAVQAAPWLDLALLTAGVDLVSVSAHKFGGPQGVGALVVRSGTTLSARTHGGGQERGLRSGTPNVAGAVGMAAALMARARRRDADCVQVAARRDALARGVLDAVGGSTWVGGPDRTSSAGPDRDALLPGHFLVTFGGVEQEELLVLLDGAGVCASAGSSCSSGAIEPSHVLLAMGYDRAAARGAVRFTLGTTTTEEEVDRVRSVLPELVARLRA